MASEIEGEIMSDERIGSLEEVKKERLRKLKEINEEIDSLHQQQLHKEKALIREQNRISLLWPQKPMEIKERNWILPNMNGEPYNFIRRWEEAHEIAGLDSDPKQLEVLISLLQNLNYLEQELDGLIRFRDSI